MEVLFYSLCFFYLSSTNTLKYTLYLVVQRFTYESYHMNYFKFLLMGVIFYLLRILSICFIIQDVHLPICTWSTIHRWCIHPQLSFRMHPSFLFLNQYPLHFISIYIVAELIRAAQVLLQTTWVAGKREVYVHELRVLNGQLLQLYGCSIPTLDSN